MAARPAWLLVAGIPLVAQGQPTFYAAWQDGLEAERAGRWKEAAGAYRRALELRPEPAARVFTYGNNLLRDYHPHTRLAHCLLELGELDEAEAVLARAKGEPPAPRAALAERLLALQARRTPARDATPTPAPIQPAATVPPPAEAPARTVPALPETALSAPPPSDAPPEPTSPGARRSAPVAPPPARPVPPPALPSPPPAPDPAPADPRPLGWAPWALGLGLTGLAALALRRLRRRGTWRARRGWGAAPPPGPEALPSQVGPYPLDRLLGRGGFSSTFLARHPATGRPVVVKVPHPHRLDDPDFRLRFRQEARLGAMLDHPNLVRILDPGPEEGAPYLVMEFVPGRTLDARLKAEGPLSVEEARRIALEVARAMAHAHSRGVVHRDLKPGNILLSPEGVRVMDLGIARVMDAETVTTTYAFLGTPLYAAPEVQVKTHVGPAADRYSLGVILFHMLAGRPPFQGETPFEILDRHRSALPPDLGTLRPEAPRALVRLVARLLDKEADQRPEDGEIVTVLEGLGPENPPGARPPD